MKMLARKIAKKIRSKTLYKLCRFYVNSYNNDSDCDIRTNGELFLMKNFIKPNDIVFDVGAGDGDWSYIAKKNNPDINLFCFEPSSNRFENLLFKISGGYIPHNFGFGEKQQKVYLYHNVIGGSNSIHQSELSISSTKEEIEILKLDDYVKNVSFYVKDVSLNKIDYLKIDVEGHELSVLKGAENLLRSSLIKNIQFEYSPNYIDAGITLKDIFKYVKSINPKYVFHKVYPNRIEKMEPYQHQYENFNLSTWLVICNDN